MGSALVHQAPWLPHRPRHIYIAGTLLEDPLGCIDSCCLKQILISSWSNVIQTKPNSGKWSILSLLVTSPQEHRLCDGTLAFCQMEAILQQPKKNLELIKPQNLFEIIFSSRKMRVVQDYAPSCPRRDVFWAFRKATSRVLGSGFLSSFGLWIFFETCCEKFRVQKHFSIDIVSVHFWIPIRV
jgi:hypothetical protein